MSNKRQKVETVPCVEYARGLLEHHLINDLVGIILDEYAPFIHNYCVFFQLGTHEWHQLDYPCCDDCKLLKEIRFHYKERSGKQKGPFVFSTSVVSRTDIDGKWQKLEELVFVQDHCFVDFKRTPERSVFTPNPPTNNLGTGINEMVDIAFVETEKFLARHMDSVNVLGSQSQ